MADMLAFLGLSGLVKQLIYHLWSDRLPQDAVLVGHVKRLNIFPVKSMMETDVEQMECTTEDGCYAGDLIDRQWMVVSSDNVLVSIRQEPSLLRIQPRFDGKTLSLTSPGYDDVTVNVTEIVKRNEIIKANKHGLPVFGLDCGKAVGKWLDDFIGRGERGRKLLYSGGHAPKRTYVHDLKDYVSLLLDNNIAVDIKRGSRWKGTDPKHKTLFQDISPVHLLSLQSVADLNSRLEEPVDVLQFRPNIVVCADDGAFDEDTWLEICIGNARFRTSKLMDRCVLPTIDRKTCKRNQKNEPLKTLKSYRCVLPGLGPMLGTDLVVERPGLICVGDPIYVVRGDVIHG